MANKQVKIKKIRENSVLPIKNNGNWYDLQTSAMICMQQHNIDWKWCDVNKVTDGFVKVRPGDTLVCYLGIACDMGEGYEAHLLPRSSTYLKYGLLLGNSMGLIDSEYKGDTDECKALFYCTDYAVVRWCNCSFRNVCVWYSCSTVCDCGDIYYLQSIRCPDGGI